MWLRPPLVFSSWPCPISSPFYLDGTPYQWKFHHSVHMYSTNSVLLNKKNKFTHISGGSRFQSLLSNCRPLSQGTLQGSNLHTEPTHVHADKKISIGLSSTTTNLKSRGKPSIPLPVQSNVIPVIVLLKVSCMHNFWWLHLISRTCTCIWFLASSPRLPDLFQRTREERGGAWYLIARDRPAPVRSSQPILCVLWM